MFDFSYYSFSMAFICIGNKMKYLNKILIVLLFLNNAFSTQAQSESDNKQEVSPYLYMLGQIATYPPLTDLIQELDSGQLDEVFSLSTNEYEIKSFEKGLGLIFNQNFVLKEIQFYDSGYVFSRCDKAVPMDLDFGMKLKDFQNYTYDAFEVDTFNKFIYHGDLGIAHAKLYFKNNRIELVKFYTKDSFLNAQNQTLRSEWGMRIIPDGKCMTGNCFDGNGGMKWPTSLQYTGEWESGIPHGTGTFSDTSGMAYSGGFKLGYLWGEGVLNIPKNVLYEGHFVLGRRMGFGNATFSNGTRYEGQWYRDLMHGQGHFWFSPKYHYKGAFSNNQFNGIGKLVSPEGYVEGTFKNGRPHGFCKQVVNGSQTALSGTWVNGKKEGNFELYSPLTGTVYVKFENDIEMR
ncbi:MAG: hypothetical protein ACI9JN_000946 [Bacteroidia bacterium]|jgi:hypothetical protein